MPMLLLIILSLFGCSAEDGYIRLPNNARPIHYTLEIAIFTENLTTRGEVIIYLEITKPTDSLTMHASVLLSIIRDRVRVREQQTPGWKNVAVLSQSDEPGPTEQHWIHLERQLTKGSHVWLTVPFKGIISEGEKPEAQLGLFMGDDMNMMAITQFEPIYARWAFPCFDEPHLKATFSVSVGRHKDQVSCSNACLTLKLPSCIQFCQRQFFAWMDSPKKKISFSPRGRGIVMVIALRTITTKVDKSIEFIDGLYQKALEKKKELKGTYATSLFLDSLKSNFTENPAFKNLSIPPEWSVLAESGIGSPSSEYNEFADISAEQALKILETGLDKIYQDHGREVLEANIKHLLKPIVSDISLNRLTKIRNKISARALDTSKREKGETEATRLRYLKEKVETTVRLMNMYEKKMYSFKKCLPMIVKVIGPLLATFKE